VTKAKNRMNNMEELDDEIQTIVRLVHSELHDKCPSLAIQRYALARVTESLINSLVLERQTDVVVQMLHHANKKGT
jgi:hypothetical protein